METATNTSIAARESLSSYPEIEEGLQAWDYLRDKVSVTIFFSRHIDSSDLGPHASTTHNTRTADFEGTVRNSDVIMLEGYHRPGASKALQDIADGKVGPGDLSKYTGYQQRLLLAIGASKNKILNVDVPRDDSEFSQSYFAHRKHIDPSEAGDWNSVAWTHLQDDREWYVLASAGHQLAQHIAENRGRNDAINATLLFGSNHTGLVDKLQELGVEPAVLFANKNGYSQE